MARPRKIKSVETFNKLADAYFAECDAKGEPYLITGLAMSLGLCSRSELMDYEVRPEFSHAVKRAKLRVERAIECSLAYGNGNPAGDIFRLKNFGWRDKQEIEHSGDRPPVVFDFGSLCLDEKKTDE